MKKVIVTIDTEGHRGNEPVEKLIWGKATDGKEYGINRLMDICDRFGVKALFFVDIAEAWDYGKEKIADVILHILERGHDVGVHIHPDHMADKNRLFLWEYSKEEQFDIIKKCTDLYKEITGKYPVAFRAGKYGANRDTLDILSELGYRFDFSQFYGQKWCGINPPVAYVLPRKYKNVIEIPVTIYGSIKLGKYIRYDKIDAEMNYSEYKHIMDLMARDNRDIVVSLFYHSFSMLDWRECPDKPTLNKAKEKNFIRTLKYINDSSFYDFISLENLSENTERFLNDEDDTIDNITKARGLIRSIWYTFEKAYFIRKTNKKARLLVYSVLAIILVILLTVLSLIYIIIK